MMMGIASRLLIAGLVVAGGALVVAGVIAAPKALQSARPRLRTLMKSGLQVYAKTRSAAAEFADDVEDLFAEVTAELANTPEPKAADQQHKAANQARAA
jgi:hypothetical protein